MTRKDDRPDNSEFSAYYDRPAINMSYETWFVKSLLKSQFKSITYAMLEYI